MVNRKKLVLIGFISIVVIIAFLVISNFEFIRDSIEKNVAAYGYPFVFVSAFLADLFFQPFGPEVPSIFAFFLGLNKWIIFLLVLLGSYSASIIGFYVGKKFLADKILVFCKVKSRVSYCKLYQKYGKLSLFIAAISPVPYVVFVWLSGAFQMSFKDFVYYGLIPRGIRIFIVLFFLDNLFTFIVG